MRALDEAGGVCRRVRRRAGPVAACALIACCLLAAPPANAGGFLRAQARQIVDEQGNPVLLRGIGLGGWMLQEGYMLEVPGSGTQRSIRKRISELIGPEKAEVFYQAWRDNHVTKADIDALAAWGFNSVRLPMHYELYTSPVSEEPVHGQQTWREEGFRRTDQLLSWVKANGMYLVLDLHAAPGGQGNDLNIADRDPAAPSLWDDAANRDKMVALWRKLAERYKDEPAIAAYDIINEPNWGFADAADKHGCSENGNAPLRELLVRTTRAIREIDRRHIVVIEGNCWGNNYRGVLDQGPWDDNLVISFHKYWNGTGRDTIKDQLALRERWNMPLWLGETGENSNDWLTRTMATVESEGIGWAVWPMKKIRYNNPLQIQPNAGYDKALAYWRGEGGKPAPAEAQAALMTLAAHDIRFEHNTFHPDVVDALLRAPGDDRSVPFKDHRIGAGGGTIAAVDFDMGRNGVAYRDLTPANESGKPNTDWNPSKTYRNDGVDLAAGNDGLQVDDMQPGEWLKYTFMAASAGRYELQLLGSRGEARVTLNGVVVGKAATGRPRAVALLEGRNTLVIEAVSAGTDLQSLQFRPLPAASERR
ncbi:cellulase family glycosylhydrolase [Lysobacter sp. S4-A87]|uniref:cellulase family glycosylhydrolase n=1 Tax=Lysobacter sp. S4-A87 TaxID=2925843 RepID=UPI001F52B83F|nr:cellulase family glycosylhydrolase [Lysobacter sp. S4-A87]UNK48738.1 cellulase family glycosylhydrolase [Lysobacter sp. S4-A87]